MSSPPSSGKPSPSLGKVGRLFTKRQSVQLTHQKSLRHYLTRDKLPREDHYRFKCMFCLKSRIPKYFKFTLK